MLRVKSLLLGTLLVALQLGCGGSPRGGVKPPPSNAHANISISPTYATPGSADLSITITASDTFSLGGGGPWINKVLWSANGSDTELSATLISSSQLTAIIPAALLTSEVQAELRVEVWDRIEGSLVATSSSVPFTVASTTPSPSISSISPSAVVVGSPDVTIMIDGSNFGHYGHFIWSTAFWTTNGNLHDTGKWLETTILSNNQLTAVIPAELLKNPNSVQIVVINGDIMGMSDGYFGYPRSNSVIFSVTP